MDIRFFARAADGRSGQEGLAEHARRRVQQRLRHRSERVAHVWVRFGDTAAARGCRDTFCVMQVQLHGAAAATVVDIGTDVHGTIDRAVDRLGRLVEEQLSDRHD